MLTSVSGSFFHSLDTATKERAYEYGNINRTVHRDNKVSSSSFGCEWDNHTAANRHKICNFNKQCFISGEDYAGIFFHKYGVDKNQSLERSNSRMPNLWGDLHRPAVYLVLQRRKMHPEPEQAAVLWGAVFRRDIKIQINDNLIK